MPLTFDIKQRSSNSRARIGRVTTPHGSFDTPAFMPVGTRAGVKGILPGMVGEIGAQIVLANTYHLMLRPGSELIQRRGGLHPFMNWDGPILTDSGGYQAYSMADINSVDDDGVTFKSILDGSRIHLTPELATRVQNELGADIIMAFDDCPPSIDPDSAPPNQARLRMAVLRDQQKKKGYDHGARLKAANERTIRWLERCKAAHARPHDQALFGIIQGGTDLDARTWSAERVCQIDLPGYAIGGVAVGEGSDDIGRVVGHTTALMPEDKPRYLMGVGYERDLLGAVLAGVDMFDCVLPTRNGRNANAFTRTGQMRLRNARFAEDDGPLDEGCDCPACDSARYGWAAMGGTTGGGRDSHFTRAYIRHLFLADEMLGPILVSLHNLRHFQRLMMEIRRAISDGDWAGLVERWPVAAAGLPDTTVGQ